MKRLVALIDVVLLAACTSSIYRPMIDSRNVDMNKFESDLRRCQQYTTQVGGAGRYAAAAVIVDMPLGPAVAAIAGSDYYRGPAARVGDVAGGASGGVEGESNQRDFIRRCITRRGYTILQ